MILESGFIDFRIDPHLKSEVRRHLELLIAEFEGANLIFYHSEMNSRKLTVDFISESNLSNYIKEHSFKICVLDQNQGLFSFGQSLEDSFVDAIVDSSVDPEQIARLVAPLAHNKYQAEEQKLYQAGVKNLKKLDLKSRRLIQELQQKGGRFTSKDLLDYAQMLVDLEKELIQSENLIKMEKVLKIFVKTNFDKTKIQLLSPQHVATLEINENLLALPVINNSFLMMELNWQDENDFNFIKKILLIHTLMSYFSDKLEIRDPFFDEILWDGVLDAIPFPIALLSKNGEIHQHNSLFAKLNLTPQDCLHYKLREKIIIQDIPYNVFRKDVEHLGLIKTLFVFFTESFFLKGDGNLTPSGQELGIISSSIAHELNNPIAGIQAAMSLLMLDDQLNDEAKSTLEEMKNGANRCKQLIETFLGFSRATPRSTQASESNLSRVEICYQQALNLLRFRTVESGIRFSLEFSRHSEFRHQVNLSLLTMTFYLVLGELMTLYSHQLLIADKNQIEKNIKGELIESSQEIQIQLHELNISALSLSKLIQNLLTIENFVLQVSDYSLRFIYTSKGV